MKITFHIECVSYPLFGIGRYAYELGKALQRSSELDDFILWGYIRPRIDWPNFDCTDNSQIVSTYSSVKHCLKQIPRITANLFNMTDFIRMLSLKKYKEYIYHDPDFYLPPKTCLQLSTIHDLSTLRFPEYHIPQNCKRIERVLKTLKQRADLLITVSEFSRIEIIRLLSWPPDKVVAVPNAPASMFVPQSCDILISNLRDFDLIPQGYCLYVGSVEPRKNIGLLLDVFESLPNRVRKAYPLVIVGHQGWKSQDVHQRIEKLSTTGWVRYLGYCSSRQLPILMAGAVVFLYPSLYEGFGLPPLEAMSCGVPTIVSDRASLPEVVGPDMPCLEAENVDIWRETILRCLEDKKWRQELSVVGLKRAAEFSWDRSATETINCYRKVLNL
jgi:alpha-1,3-rhamnosyl/mannosyltransferase